MIKPHSVCSDQALTARSRSTFGRQTTASRNNKRNISKIGTCDDDLSSPAMRKTVTGASRAKRSPLLGCPPTAGQALVVMSQRKGYSAGADFAEKTRNFVGTERTLSLLTRVMGTMREE